MIARAEDWLVEELRRILGSHIASIESGPGDWSESYLARVLQSAPAVRVVFTGASARSGADLTIDSWWRVYIVTGWSGGGQRGRRRGQVGQIGAYRALELAAPLLHNVLIPDAGRVRVTGIDNLWTGELDRAGVAVYAVTLTLPLTLEPELDDANYDEFLRAGLAWKVSEETEEEADLSRVVTIREEET